MELKRLSWLHSYQYNSLPSEYKVMKKDYNKIRSELLRKIKRLDKIKDEVKCLNDEIGILSQKHNKLFRELDFINKLMILKNDTKKYNEMQNGCKNLAIKFDRKLLSYKMLKIIKILTINTRNINNV